MEPSVRKDPLALLVHKARPARWDPLGRKGRRARKVRLVRLGLLAQLVPPVLWVPLDLPVRQVRLVRRASVALPDRRDRLVSAAHKEKLRRAEHAAVSMESYAAACTPRAAAMSSKTRSSPASSATFPVNPCQRNTATSTYRASISIA